MEDFELIRLGIVNYIIIVCSISVHEWAHAFAADRLGDPLPRYQGRVTLNPIAHMDMLGTVIIPLLMIFLPVFSGNAASFAFLGWGKPVMLSLPNQKTKKRDHMVITAAGPISNLLIAILCAVAMGLSFKLGPSFAELFQMIILVNCALFVFNLIPIPPLDGATFLRYLTRMREETYFKLSQWGFLILLILINLQPTRALFNAAIAFVTVNVDNLAIALYSMLS